MSDDMRTFCDSLDFRLLRKQKAYLLAAMDKLPVGEPEHDALGGLLNLLDDLQDTAYKAGFPAFGESKNENCLRGIKCPKCGSESQFSIQMTSMIDVTDDGTDFHKDTDWDGMSFINCHECGEAGRVWEFQA